MSFLGDFVSGLFGGSAPTNGQVSSSFSNGMLLNNTLGGIPNGLASMFSGLSDFANNNQGLINTATGLAGTYMDYQAAKDANKMADKYFNLAQQQYNDSIAEEKLFEDQINTGFNNSVFGQSTSLEEELARRKAAAAAAQQSLAASNTTGL